MDPVALIQRCTTGHCTVHLPEMLFDIDGPGHSCDRSKSGAQHPLRDGASGQRELQTQPAQEPYPQEPHSGRR